MAAIQRQTTAEGLLPPAMIAMLAVAAVERLGRRPRELAIVFALAIVQTFIMRYVGNIFLSPIDIIILTFYQDWVPILVGCCLTLGFVALAAVDPGFLNSSVAFQREIPIVGMSYRAAAVLVATGIALVVWRSGTQLARDQLTGMLSRAGAERVLEREIARGHRPAVSVCDIDNFRMVNLELGSAAGDKLLRHVGGGLERVARTLPGAWLCARLGPTRSWWRCTTSPMKGQSESLAHRIEAGAAVPASRIAPNDVPVRLSIGAATAAPARVRRR